MKRIESLEELSQHIEEALEELCRLRQSASVPPEIGEADVQTIQEELMRIRHELQGGTLANKDKRGRRHVGIGRIVTDQLAAWQQPALLPLKGKLHAITEFYRRKG